MLDKRLRRKNKIKETHELQYWKRCKTNEEQLSNRWYEVFYTKHFGLTKIFYSGKRVLDIGCGPRGSLEWVADIALECIGVDPLAEKYQKLGAVKHTMKYVTAYAENMPFPDNYFDIITSFNSLDHVTDIDQVCKEIIRVLKANGLFLLLTDIHPHHPTIMEPLTFSWNVVEKFFPALSLIELRHYEKQACGMYQSITEGKAFNHWDKTPRYGVLSAAFIKNGTFLRSSTKS